MHMDGALRFGSSFISGGKLPKCTGIKCPPPQFVTLSRADRQPVCEIAQFSNSDSCRMHDVTDKGGRNNNQFVSNALSIRENDQSLGTTQNSPTYCVSAETAAEKIANSISSRRGNSIAGAQPVQPVLVLASVPSGEPSKEDNEERIRQLDALAALRQGRILGDSQVFRQTYVIRSYEVSADGTTSIDTILSLFQEVALNHVSLLGIAGVGFGATRCMNRNRLIWVITRLHVEVDRYPAWPEVVEIDSWVGSAGKNGMRRDWLLREYATGKVIAKATSTWVMMHIDTRRLSRIPDDVKAEIEPVFIEKSAIADLTLERIPKLDDTAENIKSNLTSCRADLDVNQHINNVTYVRWVMQSTPPSTLETHEVSSVTLEYRRECSKDDVVESLTNVEESQLLQEAPQVVNGTALSSNGSPNFISNPLVNGHALGSTGSTNAVSSPLNGTNVATDFSSTPLNGYALSTNGHISLSSSTAAKVSPTLQYTHLLRTQTSDAEIVRGRTVWKPKSPKSQQQ